MFRAVEKSVRACVLMTIFVTCPFPPTPNTLTENNKSATENRFTISQKSLSFRSFFRSLLRLSSRSLSFSSQKAFVVVTVIKDLVTKRERFAVKLFQITFKGIHTELGIIHTSAEPTAWHPIYRLPTFGALVQCYQFEWCPLRLFLHA